VNIPATFNYGLRIFNDQSTSGNNVEMPITQMGNVQADLEVSMAGNLSVIVGIFLEQIFSGRFQMLDTATWHHTV